MQKIGTRLYGCISKYFDLFLLSGWQLASCTCLKDERISISFATSNWRLATSKLHVLER
jgi:hypothetical protein